MLELYVEVADLLKQLADPRILDLCEVLLEHTNNGGVVHVDEDLSGMACVYKRRPLLGPLTRLYSNEFG